MTEHTPAERPRSRAKTSKTFIYFLIAAIIISSIGIFLYLRQMPPGSEILPGQKDTSTTLGQLPTSSQNLDEKNIANVDNLPGNISLPAENGLASPGKTANEGEAAATPEENPAEKKQPPAATVDYDHLIDELNDFYAHLDQQPYMQDFGLKEPSKVHFSRLLQKLIDNPPVVIRETDDLFTLLQNTAHFFRILDQENITILKGILDREKGSFEQILKTFYTLTYQPEYLQREYSLNIPLDGLHDYAGFFLNTIGGRLYLFRRDSASRMTVSYYSIMVIDRANREGSSRLGIDLRPAVDSLIEEMENTGKNLKFKDEYLETLYDLKERLN
ncbi:MAG: hypothetical protein VR65_27025 [Desulfobulbaceae bacterium BRH_c16a]|nr:MAG: hypothetical protein VR65_27025 [Desulfobulbaceae bacterium BRH_c16a]